MVFFDFSKAFDSVTHIKLVNKLYAFGFPHSIVNWIQSYLHSRRQCVALRGSYAPWTQVTSGVPQGSVLGPLLFNIFTSDLPKGLRCNNCMYADGLKIFAPSAYSTNLQHDIDYVSQWSKSNSLSLNPGKCVVLHFGHNNPQETYTINDIVIPVKTSHSDLGVQIDSSLKFHLHAEQTITRIFRKAHFILNAFSKLTARLFSTLYKTFLHPIFDYCFQI